MNIAVRFCVLFREGKETQWRAAKEGVGVRVETCRWCWWLTTEGPVDHNTAINTHDAHTHIHTHAHFAGRSIVRLLKAKQNTKTVSAFTHLQTQFTAIRETCSNTKVLLSRTVCAYFACVIVSEPLLAAQPGQSSRGVLDIVALYK